MEHWSKTSTLEPLPLGRRKKKPNLEVSSGDQECPSLKIQKVQKDFPIVRVPHGNFMSPIEATRDIKWNGESASKIQVDQIDSPKFIRNRISSLQNGIEAKDHQTTSGLRVKPSPEMHKIATKLTEKNGTETKVVAFVSGSRDEENGAEKIGKKIIQKNPKPPAERPSTSSSSGQEEKYQNKSIMARQRVKDILHKNEAEETEKNFIQKNAKRPSERPSTSSSSSGQEENYQKKPITARQRAKDILREYRSYCQHLLADKHINVRRIDFLAAEMIKRKFPCGDQPFLGSIPGVEIGDQFHYRMELHLLGLHRPPQGGIDFMHDGIRKIAISVVASGGYENYMSNQETLIYCGQGGNNTNTNGGGKLAEDQKLKGGNLALKNSRDTKNPVRVIRGSKGSKTSTTFFYDGLYTVEKMWEDKGLLGKKIFKFKLVKIPGQASMLGRRNLSD